MTIKKYVGKTRDEALDAAKADLGEAMVVMNVKTIRGKGLRRFLGGTTYEVTAAIEDESAAPSYQEVMNQRTENQIEKPASTHFIDAVADDDTGAIVTGIERASTNRHNSNNSGKAITSSQEDELRDAMKAVSEVLEQSASKEPPVGLSSTYDRNASLIKYNDPSKSFDYTDRNSRKDARAVSKAVEEVKTDDATVRPKQQPVARTETIETEKIVENKESADRRVDRNNGFIKAVYRMLLEQEVDEKYINDILMDIDFEGLTSAKVEAALGLVYSKLILKFGRPAPIKLIGKGPRVVFFVGPTGVGKTTTIAKLASEFKISQNKKVAIFTADTYRIAAQEQLASYASIMDTPLEILYLDEDINERIAKYHKYDLILVDTTGFSHKSNEQKANLDRLLNSVSARFTKDVFLVLSAATKYRDLKDIVDAYSAFTDYNLIFTKLDETNAYGNVLNIKLYTGSDIGYVTMGQEVPIDIEIIDTQKMTNNLLGGD